MSTVSASSDTAPVPQVPNADPELQMTKETEISEGDDDHYRVVMGPEDDPKNLPLLLKWFAIIVIAVGAACATSASSMAAFTEPAIIQEFHISRTVAILGISLYVEGLGIGPLLVGPLSEVHGRNIIYQVSFLSFFLFSWPVAFAPNIAVYLVFRFLTGFCASAFLSVAGGTMSDLFANADVPGPMALYALCAFAGPILGPLIGGFVNQHLNWRWTYYILIIWSLVQLVMLTFCIPETFEPLITKRMAERKRKETGDQNYWAPIERRQISLGQAMLVSCYRPFQLIIFDRMALLLDLWNALILGILYLAFQAFPVIFSEVHHFNPQSTGLSFLGIGVGMVFAASCTPLLNKLNKRVVAKYDGNPPPEARLIVAQLGAVLIPIGLFWIAFTTYPSVHWIVPIIASIPFGAGIIFAFTSTMTYMIIAYRPIAASALASNSFMRSTFAAVFPLFAPAMYNRLGTVGATALLAGLTTLMLPLPFIFHRIGGRLREASRFAV